MHGRFLVEAFPIKASDFPGVDRSLKRWESV